MAICHADFQVREGEMSEEIFLEAQWKVTDHSGKATPQTNHSRAANHHTVLVV